MTIARAIRIFLAFVTLTVIAWAFIDVGRRSYARYSESHERPITLTVLHWGSKEEDDIVQSLTARFEVENPKVRIVRINAAGEFKSKIKTMMAAGTPPDVFYLPPDLLPEFVHMKLVAPVDQYLDKEPKAWRDDFFPLLLDAWRYDIQTERIGTGPIFGLPKDFTTAVFYVNVDLFNKAGVPVPYKGWTWDEFEAAMKKITALNKLPEFKDRDIYGGMLQIWPDTLRNVLWTFGGDFFGTRPDGSSNFRDVALDEPAAQEALQMIVRTRLTDQTVFNTTGIDKDGGQEFFNGNIGCLGPIGRWMTPRYSTITKFKWDAVPVPYKLAPASQIYYTAWSMSSSTKHPDESFKLMKFLTGKEGQIQQARAGLAIPCLQSVANSDDFLKPETLSPHNSRVFLDAVKYARIQQFPRQAEWTRIVDDNIKSSIQLGASTTLENAKQIERYWLDELDSPLRRKQFKPVRWDLIVTITLIVITTTVTVLWMRARREKLGAIDLATERAGWTFILPWLIGFLVLTAGPMIVSLLLSFTKWTAMTTLGQAEFVGAANYQQLFTTDPTFFQSLKVTTYFLLLAVPVLQIAALAVALLMNSNVRGIALFRTVYFVPTVVSGAALAVLWLQIFNKKYGVLNAILDPILAKFGSSAPDWFGTDAAIWAIPAFVIMGLWGVGGGMILYLAGLKGIPVSLYEAAIIDGAGAMRRFWNVTLPMLSPLIFYNLVMGIIGSFQVFTQAYIMTGAGPNNATLFYVLSLYRNAFEFHNMGYASAMAWILFVIILLLTLLVFRGSRRLVYYEGLKS